MRIIPQKPKTFTKLCHTLLFLTIFLPAPAFASGVGLSFLQPIGGGGGLGLGGGISLTFGKFVSIPISLTYYHLGGIPGGCLKQSDKTSSVCAADKNSLDGTDWFQSHLFSAEAVTRIHLPIKGHELYLQGGGVAFLPMTMTLRKGQVAKDLHNLNGYQAINIDGIKTSIKNYAPYGWQGGLGFVFAKKFFVEFKYYQAEGELEFTGDATAFGAGDSVSPTTLKASDVLGDTKIDLTAWGMKLGLHL